MNKKTTGKTRKVDKKSRWITTQRGRYRIENKQLVVTKRLYQKMNESYIYTLINFI